MDWRILVTNIRQSMLKLPTHYGFHDLFLNLQFLKNIIINIAKKQPPSGIGIQRLLIQLAFQSFDFDHS